MSRALTTKIGIIGRVDLQRKFFDGQTVKTRMMYRLLSEMFGEENLFVVDTRDYRSRTLAVMAKTIKCLFTCDDIFVLLSRNGRRVLFPILSLAARVRGVRIYHNLIGGWLAQDLEKNPEWVHYLNSFEVNWVESSKLVDNLSQKGVVNARYLQNFKYLDCGDLPDCKRYDSAHYFCIFSRITEMKGIGDAAHAIEAISLKRGTGNIRLDVYGPVDEGYRTEFEELLQSCPHTRYCGCVEPEKSVTTISRYEALLFPTKWKLEGIPGTIIDALSAGVPVIASKWAYYNEMLEDGVTGLSYRFGCQELLAPTIEEFISLGSEAQVMREHCRQRALQYTPQVVEKLIREAMDI